MFGIWAHAATIVALARGQSMDEACFQDLVDRLGDDLTTWPPLDRIEGEAMLLVSRRARDILDEARDLRAAFAALPTPAAPADLASRILALTERADSPRSEAAA